MQSKQTITLLYLYNTQGGLQYFNMSIYQIEGNKYLYKLKEKPCPYTPLTSWGQLRGGGGGGGGGGGAKINFFYKVAMSV